MGCDSDGAVLSDVFRFRISLKCVIPLFSFLTSFFLVVSMTVYIWQIAYALFQIRSNPYFHVHSVDKST